MPLSQWTTCHRRSKSSTRPRASTTGRLVHNFPNLHNNLWSKQVPILEGLAHIPVSVAQMNSHLHPLPQTKNTGQETVEREKKKRKDRTRCVRCRCRAENTKPRGTSAARNLTRKYAPNLQFSYPTSIAPLLMTELAPEAARTARKQLSNTTVTDKEAGQKEGRIVRNSISVSHWPVDQQAVWAHADTYPLTPLKIPQ